jgi:hypothetical protein
MYQSGAVRGRKMDVLITTALFIGSRQLNIPRTLEGPSPRPPSAAAPVSSDSQPLRSPPLLPLYCAVVCLEMCDATGVGKKDLARTFLKVKRLKLHKRTSQRASERVGAARGLPPARLC